MAATILYMSISLDGFIAGPNEGPDNGLGDGGERLHEWIWTSDEPSGESSVPARPSGVNGTVWDEFMSTGAVVAGRGTFEPAGGWAATTTTAYRSSSSTGGSRVSTLGSGRWSLPLTTSRPR